MLHVLVINGVNLNLLGIREKEHYGTFSLTELEKAVAEKAARLGIETDFFQSNHEGALVEAIHAARGRFSHIIINPAAHTHYSLAIHDAIKGSGVPAIEVHISNIHARESFRKHSVVAPACIGQISGFGMQGYFMALEYIHSLHTQDQSGEDGGER